MHIREIFAILLLLIAFIVNDQLCVCFGMCSLNDNCIIFASVLLDKITLIEFEIQWIWLLQNLVLKFRTLKFLNYKFCKLKSEIFSIKLLTLILDQSREKKSKFSEKNSVWSYNLQFLPTMALKCMSILQVARV